MVDKHGRLARLAGKGVYPHQLAWALLIPVRDLFLSPAKLARRLELREDSVVLELGCGPGYFSPSIAKLVPKGKLYLTDIQPEMLKKAAARLRKRNIENIDLRVCDGTTLPYEDHTFDLVYLVTVLGEVANQSEYAKEMYRILRPGGTVSVSEQIGDPDRLSLENVKSILIPAGFVLKTVFGKGKTYTANFTKPATDPPA